jgi:UDP-N-acetylmuramoyl-tripeptide--D-alanyl-D-alanine ligase
LGKQAGKLHTDVGRFLADTDVDRVFLKGDFSRATAKGAMAGGMEAERVFFYEQPGQILGRLRLFLKKGDWILVKGSRKMKMEEMVQSLIADFGLIGIDA